MIISITNQNFKERYGACYQLDNLIWDWIDERGIQNTMLQIEHVEDLVAIDSAARLSNSEYQGLYFHNNQLTLIDATHKRF